MSQLDFIHTREEKINSGNDLPDKNEIYKPSTPNKGLIWPYPKPQLNTGCMPLNVNKMKYYIC
jgi:hypothetical protein